MTATADPLTRTPRQSLRRARGWLVLVAVLVVGVGVALAVQLSLATTSADPMGAGNPGQQGGQALARVLAEHGIRVQPVGTLQDVRRVAEGRADTTVLLSDPAGLLDAAQLRTVLSLGSDVVAIDPGFSALDAIAPGVHQAGRPEEAASRHPSCDVRAANDAGALAGARQAYRTSQGATGCFPLGSAYALAQTTHAGTTVTVVGPGLFDNEHVGDAGNAALAIGLLGAHRTLVWYLPTQADVRASGPPNLAEITPGWLTPAILLLIAVVVAAAVWRGRRFGPLVVEDLPVTVPAGETLHGRARLYRRASARTHALDALRIGTLRRIGALCGLPPAAHVDQIVASAAALTGMPAAKARDLLLETTPTTDAAMLAAASALRALEDDVRRAVAGDEGPTGSTTTEQRS